MLDSLTLIDTQNRIITCNETCVHFHESKQQILNWKHSSFPLLLKACATKSAGNVMFIVFIDINKIIPNHLVPPENSVSEDYYAHVIKSDLIRAEKKKVPDLIQFYTMTTRFALRVTGIMETLGIKILSLLYSQDLVICYL